ncbi:MAG: DegT/DnrJ/EryC1/StrS family aminotransferase [candidate division WOR-3 bacterium]
MSRKLASAWTFDHIYFVSSGRAALWLALRAAAALKPNRHDVVIPAYTCPAVASAVLKAGLKPVLCDIDLSTYAFDVSELEQKVGSSTLAIVPVHLFGFRAGLELISQCALRKGAFVIEDAAQVFTNPASASSGKDSKPKPTAHAAFFSFSRGKPLSAFYGGALITNDENLSRAVSHEYRNVKTGPFLREIPPLLSCSVYSFLSKPRWYWIPRLIPFLHLGQTRFEPEFPIYRGAWKIPALLAALVKEIPEEEKGRERNASWYWRELAPLSDLMHPLRPSYPYLRYPLLARMKGLRDKILRSLALRGVSGSLFYPCPLNELPGLREILKDSRAYPNALFLSERLITLPVHGLMGETERLRVAEAVWSACNEFRSTLQAEVRAPKNQQGTHRSL